MGYESREVRFSETGLSRIPHSDNPVYQDLSYPQRGIRGWIDRPTQRLSLRLSRLVQCSKHFFAVEL